MLGKMKVKILVFGTFDGLHQGHLHFLKQAQKLVSNPFLVVSVARDKNVKRIKGYAPDLDEKKRMMLVKKCDLVDKVILAGDTEHIPHIIKEKPDIIALGYDQSEYVKDLKKDLKKGGLMVKIVRLKPYKQHVYKNHLLKKINLLK